MVAGTGSLARDLSAATSQGLARNAGFNLGQIGGNL
jgi:hypothetical protein